MKIGIKRIEFIEANFVQDWSTFPAGSVINLSNFTQLEKKAINFTPGTAEYTKNHSKSTTGIVVNETVTIKIAKSRLNSEADKAFINELTKSTHIAIISLIDNNTLIMGSVGFPNVISYDYSESGFSSAYYTVNINCVSSTGAYLGAI